MRGKCRDAWDLRRLVDSCFLSPNLYRERPMKKLALEMEALRVESFTTQDVDARRGTVRGHDDTMETEHCSIDTCLLGTCLTLKTCRAEGDNDAVPFE
jgi:hypothetical protein